MLERSWTALVSIRVFFFFFGTMTVDKSCFFFFAYLLLFLTVELFVRQGFPVLTLPLPSRNEKCEFTLRPFLQTVSTLQDNIKVCTEH